MIFVESPNNLSDNILPALIATGVNSGLPYNNDTLVI